MVKKENLRLGHESCFDQDIDTDDSYIDLVTQNLEPYELYDVTHEGNDMELKLDPSPENSRYACSYINVSDLENRQVDQLRFSTTIEVEGNNLPPGYEVLPPNLLGDELLYMSSEKSLKATSLGNLLPKEVISQDKSSLQNSLINDMDDRKDFPPKCYHGNTSPEYCPSTSQENNPQELGLIEGTPPVKDSPPPSPSLHSCSDTILGVKFPAMDTKPKASHDLDMSNDKLVTANNKSVELPCKTRIPPNDHEPYVASPTTVSLGQQTFRHTHTLVVSTYHSSIDCDKLSGNHIPS